MVSTPSKSPLQRSSSVRQRASEVHSKMPKDTQLRAEVGVHTFLRLHRSPSTKDVVGKVAMNNKAFRSLAKEYGKLEERNEAEVIRVVRQIAVLRSKRRFSKIAELIASIRDRFSLREIAKKAQITFSHLQWIIKVGTARQGVTQKVVTKEDIDRVKSFYKANDVTMRLPYKRFAKYYYLRNTLDSTYQKYVREMNQNNHHVLSKSAVRKCLPRRAFRTMKKIPYQQCLCYTCTNTKLAIAGCRVAGLQGIPGSMTELALLNVCNGESNDILQLKRECIDRKCPQCSEKFSTKINNLNPEVDWNKTVSWYKWEKVPTGKKQTKHWVKKRKAEALSLLYGEMKLAAEVIVKHMLNFRWPGDPFEKCKSAQGPRDIVWVIDFAKNLEIQQQGELQRSFYSRQAATMFSSVIYYKCPRKCGEIVSVKVMGISADINHDAFLVRAFQVATFRYLLRSGIIPNKIYMWSDNCSSQFKSKQPFALLSSSTWKIEHNYFGAEHGKGPADAFVGRAKFIFDLLVRSKQINVSDAEGVCQALTRKMGKPFVRGECQHKQVHFTLIENVVREMQADEPEPKTLPGTRSFHSVRNIGQKGKVMARRNTCVCKICLDLEKGICPNATLVGNFKQFAILVITFSFASSFVSNARSMYSYNVIYLQ